MNIYEAVDFDSDEYERMLDFADEEEVNIVHVRTGRTGGATVAWKRVHDDHRTKMIRFAVSFCSEKDVFCRKIGTLFALSNFIDGYTLYAPIGSKDNGETVRRLRNIVTYMIYQKDY